MLTALNEKGQIMSLARSVHLSDLQVWRQTHSFYCPICQESLIMKAGEIRIPHFAHKKNSDCTSGFSEPESHQHLEGKRHLNEFFIRQGLEPSLEHYLPAIRQRPDLLVNFMGRTYAVEYQCSPLSRNSLLDRTQGYIKEGIIPLWILGGYPYQKMKKDTCI